MSDQATSHEPEIAPGSKSDKESYRPDVDATAGASDSDDDLQRPPLPEAELPEEDEAEHIGDAGADSAAGSQPQAMPGWFKLALVTVLIILLSVGYVGYLYLRGELSIGGTSGSTVTDTTPPAVRPSSASKGPQTGPGQKSASNSQATPPAQPNQLSETAHKGYTIRESVEPGLPRLNLSSYGEKAAADTAAMSSSPSPSPEEPSSQDGVSVQQQGQLVPPAQASLSGIESSLDTIEDMLRDHQGELVRLGSLIANNELTLKQQAEDLASLSSRLTQAISSQATPKNATSSRTPELSIALLSVRQMGEALGVSVRYLGSTQRLLLGQTLDGWRLTDVHMEQSSAQFTHSASGRTVTVSL